ncbi:hypothetical protein C8Q77DRAFT_246433 [Trametes polyzona]|nr:hypothetical protein C8Q77DRAFT_246433 [Trametes polyzona]
MDAVHPLIVLALLFTIHTAHIVTHVHSHSQSISDSHRPSTRHSLCSSPLLARSRSGAPFIFRFSRRSNIMPRVVVIVAVAASRYASGLSASFTRMTDAAYPLFFTRYRSSPRPASHTLAGASHLQPFWPTRRTAIRKHQRRTAWHPVDSPQRKSA